MIWSLYPTDYSNITRWSNELYKAEKNGLIGLIRPNGTIVVPVTNNEFTPFCEGKSLVIQKTNNKHRVCGVLSKTGQYTAFQQVYYTISNQEFYSDHVLTVEDENGKLGYVDENGNALFAFNKRYSEIKPFTEGHAVVKDGKTFQLIDKRGSKCKITLAAGSVAAGITNVFEGISYIMSNRGKWYEYNVSTHEAILSNKPAETFEELDYTYCLRAITNRGKTPQYESIDTNTQNKIEPFSENGLWGYKIDTIEILPSQFIYASAIEDNYAVVKIMDRIGILKYISTSNSITVTPSKPIYDCIQGKSTEVFFNLHCPDIWNGSDFKIRICNPTGNNITDVIATDKHQHSFSVNVTPTKESSTYRIELFAGELLLCSEEKEIKFNIIKPTPKLNIKIDIKGERANKDDCIPVDIIIFNPNEDIIQTDIDITGSESFKEKKEYIIVPPRNSVTIRSEFKIYNKKINNATVKVNAGKHGTCTVTKDALYPYYIE